MSVDTAVEPLVSEAQPKPKASHPLSLPRFRDFWIARSLSLLGDQFYLVAVPWVVTQLTPSNLAVGLVMLVGTVPRAALMLVGGLATDRYSSRRVLMATAAARTLLVATVAALIGTHAITLWHIVALTLAFGVTDAFSLPAAAALLPTVVPKEQLRQANAVSQSAQSMTQLFGPGMAGLVVARLGSAVAMAFDAVSFIPMIFTLWRFPDVPRAATPGGRKKTMDALLEGLRSVRADDVLLALLILFAVMNLAVSGPASVGLVLLAKARFGSAAALGTALTCFGAGNLAGSLVVGYLKKLGRTGLLIILMSVLTGLEVAALGVASNLIVVCAVLAIMGIGVGAINVVFSTWIQTRVPAERLGRVMSVMLFVSLGLTPISFALAGLGAAFSLTGMFVGSGLALAAASLVIGTRKSILRLE
jgi:MFS family permease